MGQPRPILRGLGPSVPKNFGTTYLRPSSLTYRARQNVAAYVSKFCWSVERLHLRSCISVWLVVRKPL